MKTNNFAHPHCMRWRLPLELFQPLLRFMLSRFWWRPWGRRWRACTKLSTQLHWSLRWIQGYDLSTKSTCFIISGRVGVNSRSISWALISCLSLRLHHLVAPVSVGKASTKADRFTQSSFQAYLLFCVLSNSYCCCCSCSHENKHRPCDLKRITLVPDEQAAFGDRH